MWPHLHFLAKRFLIKPYLRLSKQHFIACPMGSHSASFYERNQSGGCFNLQLLSFPPLICLRCCSSAAGVLPTSYCIGWCIKERAARRPGGHRDQLSLLSMSQAFWQTFTLLKCLLFCCCDPHTSIWLKGANEQTVLWGSIKWHIHISDPPSTSICSEVRFLFKWSPTI